MNWNFPSVRPLAKAHADLPATQKMLLLALCGPAQLGGGLLVACIVPVMVRNDFRLLQAFYVVPQYNSLVMSACALLLGYCIMGRLGRYPCFKAPATIMPAFAISYGILICAIVFLRLEYSRFFIGFSFLNVLTWFYITSVIAESFNQPRFVIVPFGSANELGEISSARWEYLMAPCLQGHQPDGIVVDLREDLSNEWQRFLTEAALEGVAIYHCKQLREDLTGKLEIEHLSENHLGSLLPSQFYLKIKKVVDVAFAILILPVLLPLFALVAIGIKWDSAGPVFFRQARVGYRGKVFTIWKFRTMRHNHSNGDDERDAAMTRNGDPRVTSFGFFLRKTRIDELPQVINILCGEMSWIGPRPEAIPLSRWYEKKIAFYRYRHIVPSGITGWGQVNQGHVTATEDVRCKLYYDFYYIKNFSIWLDLLIVLRTIAVMLSGFGSR